MQWFHALLYSYKSRVKKQEKQEKQTMNNQQTSESNPKFNVHFGLIISILHQTHDRMSSSNVNVTLIVICGI